MDKATTIWRMLIASLAVWRLSRLLLEDKRDSVESQLLSAQPENFLGDRILDCVCWLGIWLSAQTAIWVAGGLAGVLLNWFVLSILSRAITPSLETPGLLRAEAPNGDISCLTVEPNMQVNRG